MQHEADNGDLPISSINRHLLGECGSCLRVSNSWALTN